MIQTFNIMADYYAWKGATDLKSGVIVYIIENQTYRLTTANNGTFQYVIGTYDEIIDNPLLPQPLQIEIWRHYANLHPTPKTESATTSDLDKLKVEMVSELSRTEAKINAIENLAVNAKSTADMAKSTADVAKSNSVKADNEISTIKSNYATNQRVDNLIWSGNESDYNAIDDKSAHDYYIITE